ncbi:hypothetical protein AV274_6174 [Blastocystis sp. ATCC 50177/Nand II]|uniref:Uncharacterized protein n=1 Tax=Blastocystis sp. subtype 1 (strain ATCC 50177 / NandII) TaxID=478820 RepID=A0A196S6Y8_BLAHN|nr:hypothetical protein AV274_6174 [Blastocystis sp. ATCC 50177/Nand II]
MGNTLTSVVFSVLQFFGLYTKEAVIAVIGLDNAGKTTMLYRIQNDKVIQMSPSLHVNEETFTYGGVTFKAYDIGGQESFRLLWKRFLGEVDAILFLVDASDPERFHEVKAELAYLSQMKGIENQPIGLLLNKCDTRDQYPAEPILTEIGGDFILQKSNVSEVFQTSSFRPESIMVVLKWLASVV